MIGFPLLLIPLAIYNILVFLMPGVSLSEPLVRLTLVSGSEWPITLSDVLLTLGILLLLLEVFKAARPGAKYLTDHLLSFVLFAAAAAEFVLWPRFATSTYFLLTLLALSDFLAGVALRSRRRLQPVASVGPAPQAPFERPVAEPPAELAPPAATPAQEPAVKSAASVAESVLLDHPGRPAAQPAPVVNPASPEVASPGLQPGPSTADGPRTTPDEPPRQ
ncbi:hypothetical protein [Bradyrhizobium sp. NP1]|uniref:hypothetical protein n=1 Tax=Bradyrhizobium sp. NP1 TaxID=3049772 RepID=UPI0025A5C0A4|nr:hypothetical protein [Bradyrhizobium sp. NP1]WJR78118.1 hypothetical protein QOU61_36425 [Bradyrhizobium sp. NP1]